MKAAFKLAPPNKAVELTAGSHSLAAAAHRQRSPHGGGLRCLRAAAVRQGDLQNLSGGL